MENKKLNELVKKEDDIKRQIEEEEYEIYGSWVET